MSERSHSFDIHDRSYDDIQKIMENVLEHSLSFSTKTKRLGRSLFRINYFDNTLDLELQKDNRITILHEPDKKVYIQIKGILTDIQVSQLWNDFEKRITTSIYAKKIEEPNISKEEIIQEIKHSIELEGYIVNNEEIQTFIENFINKFDRLPKGDEFHSIVQGYIIMINEDYLSEKVKPSIKNETESIEAVLDIIEDNQPSGSYQKSVPVHENSVGRRKCPSCGDETSIHEVIDKSIILMDYPRIYGKKKYCGLCGYEWK